jgi:hypothetical protein
MNGIKAELADVDRWVADFYSQAYLADPERLRAILAEECLELPFLAAPIRNR